MNDYFKLGAMASFTCAICFILGLSLIMIWVPEFNDGPEQRLRTLSEHSRLMQVWYFIIYVVFSISILILSSYLLKRVEQEQSLLQKMTMLYSYLWATYVFASGLIAILSIELMFGSWLQIHGAMSDIWRDVYSVQMGLGEGVEWVGGIWIVLITLCLYKQHCFSKTVHFFGFIIAPFGLLTVIPSLGIFGAVFGSLQLIWFIWLGVLILQKGPQRVY